MTRFVTSVTLGLLFAWAVPAFAQNGGAAAESFDAPDAEWMFVQSADAITFDGKTLTLQNVAPRTIMFTDRPNRMAGNISTGRLVDDWAAGTNSFQADPPNASLSTRVGDEEQVSVVELSNPRLRGTSLSYDVQVLDGMVPPNAGSASLFIDAWRAPLGGRCHHNRWGGVKCVWGPGPRRHPHHCRYR